MWAKKSDAGRWPLISYVFGGPYTARSHDTVDENSHRSQSIKVDTTHLITGHRFGRCREAGATRPDSMEAY